MYNEKEKNGGRGTGGGREEDRGMEVVTKLSPEGCY